MIRRRRSSSGLIGTPSSSPPQRTGPRGPWPGLLLPCEHALVGLQPAGGGARAGPELDDVTHAPFYPGAVTDLRLDRDPVAGGHRRTPPDGLQLDAHADLPQDGVARPGVHPPPRRSHRLDVEQLAPGSGQLHPPGP